MSDELGDRMKMLEKIEAGRRLMPLLPAMVRIDGKNFSKFTKGLQRPYDKRLSDLMVLVTKSLVEEYNAILGYTQSDEISLILYSDNYKSQIPYDRKIQKMVGDIAAYASLVFNKALPTCIPEKSDAMPRFDCRVWNVPNITEAVNTILWRELDATKNSVSMATRTFYSHKEIHGLGRADQMDLLMKKGVNWNDYPDFFKRGTYVRRRSVEKKLTEEELSSLPSMHNARKNPDMVVERSEVCIMNMPPLTKVQNRVDVIFSGKDPAIDRLVNKKKKGH